MAAVAAMSLGALAACGSSTSGDDAKGKVYYLNFKPEAADQWTALAKEYTKEKGVDVKVQTAASGTYDQTLKSEIAKTEAPTLFQVNGPVGYQNWKKYTADMSNTDVYKELTNQDVALKDCLLYTSPSPRDRSLSRMPSSTSSTSSLISVSYTHLTLPTT